MRTLTTTKTVFSFDELSDKAKAFAIQEHGKFLSDEFDPDFTIADTATIADKIGIDLNNITGRTLSGKTTFRPAIYWQGFWSQGDGACFEGFYSYRKGALKHVKKYAPTDTELHQIVSDLQDAQKRCFYAASADCSQYGRYMVQSVDVSIDHIVSDETFSAIETDIKQALKAFADWMYGQIKREYEYVTSEQNIIDSIRANEYEFDENGVFA